MTDSGTKRAWVIHESKAVQIHVHNNRRGCLIALKSAQQQSLPQANCCFHKILPVSTQNDTKNHASFLNELLSFVLVFISFSERNATWLIHYLFDVSAVYLSLK